MSNYIFDRNNIREDLMLFLNSRFFIASLIEISLSSYFLIKTSLTSLSSTILSFASNEMIKITINNIIIPIATYNKSCITISFSCFVLFFTSQPGWTRTTDVSLSRVYTPLPSPLGYWPI